MTTHKLESKAAIQEKNGKIMETNIRTLGFIGSFLNLETFSAKR
jgi:hypothetical protein